MPLDPLPFPSWPFSSSSPTLSLPSFSSSSVHLHNDFPHLHPPHLHLHSVWVLLTFVLLTIAGGRVPSRYCNATSSTLENEVSAGTQCCTCDRVLQPVGLHRQPRGPRASKRLRSSCLQVRLRLKVSVSYIHTMLLTLSMLTSVWIVTHWHLAWLYLEILYLQVFRSVWRGGLGWIKTDLECFA